MAWSQTGTSGKLVQWREDSTNQNVLLPPGQTPNDNLNDPRLTNQNAQTRRFDPDIGEGTVAEKRRKEGYTIRRDDQEIKVDPKGNIILPERVGAKKQEPQQTETVTTKTVTPQSLREDISTSLLQRQGKEVQTKDNVITVDEGNRQTTIFTAKGSGERGRSFTVPKSAKVSEQFGDSVNRTSDSRDIPFQTRLSSDVEGRGDNIRTPVKNQDQFVASVNVVASSAKRAVTDVLGAPTKGLTGAAEKSGILPGLRTAETKLDIASYRKLQETSFARSTSKERTDVLKQRVGSVQSKESPNISNQFKSNFTQSNPQGIGRKNDFKNIAVGYELKFLSTTALLAKKSLENPVTTALTVSAIGKGSQFIATKTGSNFIANTVTGTGLIGTAALTAPKGERLASAVGFAPIVLAPSAARFVQNRITAIGSEKVPLESITTKDVATGKARFPTSKNIQESVKAFKDAPKNPQGDILITSATTTNFARETAVGQGGRPAFKVVDGSGKTVKSFSRDLGTEASRKAQAETLARKIGGSVKRVATETEGLYTTPADKTSIQFTGLAVARTPVEQKSPQLFARPQIIRLNAKAVERVPQSIIKKEGSSFELSNRYIKEKAGTGKIFITPRSEKGGTSEIEAVVPFTTKIRNVAGENKPGLKGKIARLKGYEQYVRIDNRNVPIKDFNQVITQKTAGSPAQKGGVFEQNVGSIAKSFNKSASSLSRFASERPLARLPSLSSSNSSRKSSRTSTPVSSRPSVSNSVSRSFLSTSISQGVSRTSTGKSRSDSLTSVSRFAGSTSRGLSNSRTSTSISPGLSGLSTGKNQSKGSSVSRIPTNKPPKIPVFDKGIDTVERFTVEKKQKSKRKFIGTPSLSVLSGFAEGQKLTKAQLEGKEFINPLQRRAV